MTVVLDCEVRNTASSYLKGSGRFATKRHGRDSAARSTPSRAQPSRPHARCCASSTRGPSTARRVPLVRSAGLVSAAPLTSSSSERVPSRRLISVALSPFLWSASRRAGSSLPRFPSERGARTGTTRETTFFFGARRADEMTRRGAQTEADRGDERDNVARTTPLSHRVTARRVLPHGPRRGCRACDNRRPTATRRLGRSKPSTCCRRAVVVIRFNHCGSLVHSFPRLRRGQCLSVARAPRGRRHPPSWSRPGAVEETKPILRVPNGVCVRVCAHARVDRLPLPSPRR